MPHTIISKVQDDFEVINQFTLFRVIKISLLDVKQKG